MNETVAFTPDKVQKEIIESEAAKIAVIAGAGSGKTAVLTQRIRYLIDKKGVKPDDIVAITFTNLATDEMRSRLQDIEGIEDAFIGTIHSFAYAILRYLGMRFEILTDDKFLAVAKELCEKYCHFLTADRLVEFEGLKAKYKKGEVECKKLKEFFDEDEEYEYSMIARDSNKRLDNSDYPESVLSWCYERNIKTFDEIIVIARSQIREEFKFPYILVDEYQDVGNLEDSFIRSLNADNIFIVGDDWQSIYGFKGANVSIFKDYIENPDWTVYRLEKNYRNSTEILRVAERVISSDHNRIEKEIIAVSRSKGSVLFDVQAKLLWHLKNIKKQGKYNTWFLLIRKREDLFPILKCCEMLNLPTRVFSKENMTEAEKDAQLAENSVKVMTVHAAKGLEADNVLLYGDFPIEPDVPFSCYESEAKMERWCEERRIMYVGVTRARFKAIILNKEGNTVDDINSMLIEYAS